MSKSPRPFSTHSLDDRAYWDRLRSHPVTAELVRAVMERAETIDPVPPVPQASDYLAGRRYNDRGRVDRFWQVHRAPPAVLAIRRAILGLDPADPDDRLLDWLWGCLMTPTWVVSAHLPGQDLPASGSPQLDLAACEMAGAMAEMRELLLPWINAQSRTLADTIIHEIDRRVLQPFVEVALAGQGPEWTSLKSGTRRNNWSGVCAGSILAACVSLERQGHPRPKAKALAIEVLNLFLREGFTPSGECDEGIGYWNYGVGFMCIGLQRLSPDELTSQIDLPRLREIAGYPGRAHLYKNVFYAGNDSSMRASASAYFVPWLAQLTGDPFLQRWVAQAPPLPHYRDIMTLQRCLEYLPDQVAMKDAPPVPKPRTQYLEDQQAAILRRELGGHQLLIALAGGTNSERHNHNDLGHFVVSVDEQVVIPDLGAPHYTSDFFGSRRYTFLSASSRGHCCPLINDVEQRTGSEAAGVVLERNVAEEGASSLVLDLTAAYPPEAKLRRWTRALQEEQASTVLTDEFELDEPGQVVHVIWFTQEPRANGARLEVGLLKCELSPAPQALRVVPVDPAEHRLRDFKSEQPLYRVEATYPVSDEKLTVQTRLSIV